MVGGTITVSRVEQAALLRHLKMDRGSLSARDLDGLILDTVIKNFEAGTTVPVSRIEAVTMLRHLRLQRDRMGVDMRALEERRLRGGYNGELDAAHALLDAECMILDDVIRRLWALV